MKIIHIENPDEGDDKREVTPFKTLQGRMLRYEGMTNAMNIYKISSWKNTCAAHEQWTGVITAEELSASMTVENVLEALKKILNVENVEINMCNNKFIDVIATDYPQKEFEVMIPESKLDNYIKKNKELRQLSYRTLIHKHFYENIDCSFPYKTMTLQQIGIPAFDVLQVSTENGVSYVELSADRY
jgi:Golgi nucleoside diphosphatase